jgi:sulfur carrier protein ThiS
VLVEALLHPNGVRRSLELPPNAKGLDLLSALKLAPDGHILVRGDVPLPEDELLLAGERIRVIAVVSGG